MYRRLKDRWGRLKWVLSLLLVVLCLILAVIALPVVWRSCLLVPSSASLALVALRLIIDWHLLRGVLRLIRILRNVLQSTVHCLHLIGEVEYVILNGFIHCVVGL